MPTLQISLKDGELIRPSLKSRIRVLKGRLWLTRAGDTNDCFMEPGDVAQIVPTDKPLMEAINGCALLSLEMNDTGYRLI